MSKQTLNIEWWPLEKLALYENNPRKNASAVAEVARYIEKYGWRQPIVVDAEGVIIVGHTRWKAAKKLGLDTVPVHVAKDLTPEEAKAYRIADNRSHEHADWDDEKLLAELLDLEKLGCDLADVGFTHSDVEKMLDDMAEDLQPPDVEFATELDEASNYVVLKFDRDIDFLQIQTLLGLRSVQNRTYNGKPGKMGVGRVVDGVEALKLIQAAGQEVG